MAKTQEIEKWKDVSFGFEFTNDYRLQVSNQGNLKAFNKFSPGEPLKGSFINSYRIIRLKLYQPKDKKMIAKLEAKHQAVVALRKKLKKWKLEDAKKYKPRIAEDVAALKKMQDILREARQQDIKDRTMHYHALFHRLVAENFVKPQSSKHTVVGHLDYDKMNNKAANLRWMTPQENYKHQQSSPYVIAKKRNRFRK